MESDTLISNLKYLRLTDLIGLRIKSVRGHKTRKNAKYINPSVILFDDGCSYITLHEQDYYHYHDCDTSARTLEVLSDTNKWNYYMGEEFGDANMDL